MDSNRMSFFISEITKCISRLGVMYRVFYREKTLHSLEEKINKTPGKYSGEKKIQDIVGVRIALYFIDDIDIVRNALEKNYVFMPNDSQIDKPDIESFSAVRYNLIFKLPDNFDIKTLVPDEFHSFVDNTFELQIRTILSEGWHEVDHDLRFKCKEHWKNLEKENRAFNGVYATLETSEWTLLKLFEDLAYTHYKKMNIQAMIINKFRLRLKPSDLDEQLLHYLDGKNDLVKKIYRFERARIIHNLSVRQVLPITMSNLIFIMNLDSLNDQGITEIMPLKMSNWWSICRSTSG